ncbi:MAG TPA: hypothetical protein VLL52_02670 [Anaerolineae bacterium]|nr:hypothetical protein [Anaerolineae bacterium]
MFKEIRATGRWLLAAVVAWLMAWGLAMGLQLIDTRGVMGTEIRWDDLFLGLRTSGLSVVMALGWGLLVGLMVVGIGKKLGGKSRVWRGVGWWGVSILVAVGVFGMSFGLLEMLRRGFIPTFIIDMLERELYQQERYGWQLLMTIPVGAFFGLGAGLIVRQGADKLTVTGRRWWEVMGLGIMAVMLELLGGIFSVVFIVEQFWGTASLGRIVANMDGYIISGLTLNFFGGIVMLVGGMGVGRWLGSLAEMRAVSKSGEEEIWWRGSNVESDVRWVGLGVVLLVLIMGGLILLPTVNPMQQKLAKGLTPSQPTAPRWAVDSGMIPATVIAEEGITVEDETWVGYDSLGRDVWARVVASLRIGGVWGLLAVGILMGMIGMGEGVVWLLARGGWTKVLRVVGGLWRVVVDSLLLIPLLPALVMVAGSLGMGRMYVGRELGLSFFATRPGVVLVLILPWLISLPRAVLVWQEIKEGVMGNNQDKQGKQWVVAIGLFGLSLNWFMVTFLLWGTLVGSIMVESVTMPSLGGILVDELGQFGWSYLVMPQVVGVLGGHAIMALGMWVTLGVAGGRRMWLKGIWLWR